MGQSIESLLHFETIMKVIEAVKGGVPGGILPETMFRPTEKTNGNTGTYTKVNNTRKVAQAVAYGAPSVSAKLPGVSKVPITLIHAYEHIDHEPNLLALLKSLSGGEQERGSEIVGKKIAEFGRRFVNLRRAAWYSTLVNGKIWLDADGNLLPSSVGAVITVDFGIPSGNKGQLDWNGKGAIIGASWGTAGTDIAGDLAALQKAAMSQCGYRITTAYYGANLPKYIGTNTVMKEFLKLNPGANASMLKGKIPDGFLDINWVSAVHAFYEDAEGNVQFFWGDDTVVFTPDVADAGWWSFIEGSYNIPTDIGAIYGDMAAALNSLKKIYGMFSYAQVTNDPVGLRQYFGDTMLPCIVVPKSIYIADVTP